MMLLQYTFLALIFLIKKNTGETLGQKSNIHADYSTDGKIIKKYEITIPFQFSASNLKKYSIGTKIFQVSLYEEVYDLLLEPQSNFDGVVVEHFSSNDTYQKKVLQDDNCYFAGNVKTFHNDNSSLVVALNHCDGLAGVIKTQNGVFFIQPIKTDVLQQDPEKLRRHIVYSDKDVYSNSTDEGSLWREAANAPYVRRYGEEKSRRRRSNFESFLNFQNKAGRRVQLYYLDSYDREVPFISLLVNERRHVNTYYGTKWLVKDEKTSKILWIDNQEYYTVLHRNYEDRRTNLIISKPAGMVFDDNDESNKVDGSNNYAELLIVADQSVTSFHGREALDKYFLTMVNIANIVFKDNSLGLKLTLNLKRIVLLEGNERSFTVHHKNPTRSLVSACKFVKSLQNIDVDHPDHFDFAVVVTRKDFGPSGYAQLYSMCSKRRSCVLVKDEGLTSAFIIAHETGHLLGLDHDGEGEASRCGVETAGGSIMAPIIVARYDRFHWSKCSREVLVENIEYFTCLANKPTHYKNTKMDRLPGTMYTLDEQCQFNFNRQYSLCKSFQFNPCQVLWCSEPTRPTYCRTMRGPGLEGSTCARNKHCISGSCIINEAIPYKPPTEKPVVNGNWASWESWTPCSRTCDIGVRTRKRTCTNPRPGPRGKFCPGESFENEICSTSVCSLVKPYNMMLYEECEIRVDRGWKLYQDRTFDLFLNQRRRTLNCTFESNFCNWQNDDSDEMDWEKHSGSTQSYSTGPEYDHTKQNEEGSYLYIEASSSATDKRFKGDIARLLSPEIFIPRMCFTMHYHMLGKDMGLLRVKILLQNDTELILWSKEDSAGEAWQKVDVSIESEQRYKVVVEAERGKHWAGDTAIDDLAAVTGLCPEQTKARNPCKISCRSRTLDFKLGLDVTNGFKCENSRSNNICLDGQCVTFGCDKVFNSTLQIDNCGVCGGDASSCQKVKGRKEILPKTDYEVLMTLPKGATYINLTDDTPNNHAFGLRDRYSQQTHLNRRSEEFFTMEGTVFEFTKDSQGRQHLVSDGPTRAVFNVVVYTLPNQRTEVVGLDYEFFQMNSVSTYSYVNVGWTECSQSCGQGEQRSMFVCQSDSNGEDADESHCTYMRKPNHVRRCSVRECPRKYDWLIRDWSHCSKTCGDGQKIRLVICRNVETDAVVSNTLCSQPAPLNKRACNVRVCEQMYKWRVNEWTACAVSCGGGTRSRTISCVEVANHYPVDDTRCSGLEQPDRVEPCNVRECDAFIWDVQLEGKCSKSCGGGLKVRIIYCINERSGGTVSNKYCDGPSPPRIAKCNEFACPEFVWQIGESGPCSATCDGGYINRVVSCLNKETNGEVDDSNCITQKPSEVETCRVRPCTSYHVSFGPWKPCNVLCGPGVRRRNYTCRENGVVVDSYLCSVNQTELVSGCRHPRCSSSADFECNFEGRSFCNWINDDDVDNFDWSIGSSTPSYSTGPSADHTTGSGHFAFIETSSPRRKEDEAVLLSPLLPPSNGCFVFWYHMKGANIGTLVVYLRTADEERVIFRKSEEQRDRWIQATIGVSSESSFRITFKANVAHGVYGDIAIDDIVFYTESCSRISSPQTIVSKRCVERSPHCKHKNRRTYCLNSLPFRDLCCRTCLEYIGS